MGFVYRVVWDLKALWIFLSETINFLRKLQSIKLTFSGCPRKFYHRVMYIAPSSGHIALNCNMPFKLILRRFEVVFWCLEWECCTFWKIGGNSFKSTKQLWEISPTFFSLCWLNTNILKKNRSPEVVLGIDGFNGKATKISWHFKSDACTFRLITVSSQSDSQTIMDFSNAWTGGGLGRAYVTLYVTKHVLRMRLDVDVRSLPRGRRQIGRIHVVLWTYVQASWRMRRACTKGSANFSTCIPIHVQFT